MQAPDRLIAACFLAGAILAVPPGFAQSAADKRPEAKPAAEPAAKPTK